MKVSQYLKIYHSEKQIQLHFENVLLIILYLF